MWTELASWKIPQQDPSVTLVTPVCDLGDGDPSAGSGSRRSGFYPPWLPPVNIPPHHSVPQSFRVSNEFKKTCLLSSLSTKEGQMLHVFPDITKTLLSTEEAEGGPTSSRPMTARKWGSDLNTLPKTWVSVMTS